MPRASFQFYPADWRNNANLRRCSLPARGAWIDVMCLLNDSDEYGLLRWPLAELARAASVPAKVLQELVDKRVLKGCDSAVIDAFIYVPRSGRKDGDPVTLIPAQTGPLWYSSRMVKDEYIRKNAGKSTRFGAQGDEDGVGSSPPSTPRHSPSRRQGARHGDGKGVNQGDGSSSSSSSSEIEANASLRDFDFDAFWDAYGKKVDMTRCRKVWAKLRGTDKALIEQALPAYVTSTPNPKYRKNPLTWLNGQCWNDPIEIAGDGAGISLDSKQL